MLTKERFQQNEINPFTKVAVISHNDLDGAGPVIIAKNFFINCKYFTVPVNAVDKVVKLVMFSPDYQDIEVVFITDCSITDRELIDYINTKSNKKVFLFDHHVTALWLNEYEWAHVTEEPAVSGTKLFWRYMRDKFIEEAIHQSWMDNLVNKISDYDTWEWVKKGDEECNLLSILFTNTGVNYFIDKYTYPDTLQYSRGELFNSIDKALLKDFETKFNYLIWPAVQRSAVVDIFTFIYPEETGETLAITKKVKFVTVTSSIGDMAEKLYEDGVDYVMFFYHDTVSIRSRVDDINLGAWAKFIGNGGGHYRSAGFHINSHNLSIYINYLLKKFNREEK